MNDIKEWNKQLRRRQFRKLFIHLEKFRNGNLHNQQQDIQILRRLCYCLNSIIHSALLRNENFYKKTLITVLRKQRVYLQILYELMHAHYKKKYLKFFVYELNKFLQLQSLRYKKEQQIQQALYMNSYSQLFQNWKYSCNWTIVINAILLMEKQHFAQASQELSKVYDQIQGVIRKIILYKIEKHLTEMDLKKQINKHLVMLIHTMYLHFICLLYDDDFQGLQRLIKLFHFLVKDFQFNKEQIQHCKDLIKGQRSKLILYLQEQGEINRIIRILYPQDTQGNKIQINPIDSYFYEKYNHQSINKQLIKVPSVQPRISQSKKLRTVIYKKQQQSQSPRAQQVTAQSEIKQESFSYIKDNYFSKQIQEKLQKDSFFSYLDVAKDAETCISQETERTMRAKTLYQPQRKISIDQTTKHALFRTLETQAIYYIEVQKANFQLQSIKQQKDQQQKKMITERLLAQVKPMDSASKSTFITQSQEQFDFKDQKQIYTDVHENLKNLAEAYSSTNIRPRIMSQQNNILKQSELANSITRLKFK